MVEKKANNFSIFTFAQFFKTDFLLPCPHFEGKYVLRATEKKEKYTLKEKTL